MGDFIFPQLPWTRKEKLHHAKAFFAHPVQTNTGIKIVYHSFLGGNLHFLVNNSEFLTSHKASISIILECLFKGNIFLMRGHCKKKDKGRKRLNPDIIVSFFI